MKFGNRKYCGIEAGRTPHGVRGLKYSLFSEHC